MSTVLVVGGGRVGSHLATLLLEGGHEVTVVETSQDRVARLDARAGLVVGSGTEALKVRCVRDGANEGNAYFDGVTLQRLD